MDYDESKCGFSVTISGLGLVGLSESVNFCFSPNLGSCGNYLFFCSLSGALSEPIIIHTSGRSNDLIDAFELWCWRRLLRVPWTARRSNQSILKEINPEYSSEGLMLKLKLQYFAT